MFNFITSLILASLLFPSGLNFFWQNQINFPLKSLAPVNEAPQKIINQSLGLKTTAKSILVVDEKTGTVLYQKNPNQVLPIASITKLVTALVFLDTKPDWKMEIEILDSDQRPGGMVYLLPGERVKVKDLFNLMLVASANEAAIALVRQTGLDNFNQKMNQKAQELGLKESYFLEPSGISPENVSSVTDLIKLIRVVFSQSEIIEAVTSPTLEFKVLNRERQVKAFNTDSLLTSFLNQSQYKISVGKNGHLDEAGYSLVAKIKKQNGPVFLVTLLGSESIRDRSQEIKGVVDWVERNYEWQK